MGSPRQQVHAPGEVQRHLGHGAHARTRTGARPRPSGVHRLRVDRVRALVSAQAGWRVSVFIAGVGFRADCEKSGICVLCASDRIPRISSLTTAAEMERVQSTEVRFSSRVRLRAVVHTTEYKEACTYLHLNYVLA